MNAVYGGLIQRSDTTASTLAAAQNTTSQRAARASRLKNDPPLATPASGGNAPYALHDDRLDRYIVETALAAGLDRSDLVDDVHSLGDAREDGVAEVAARMIEEVVVLQIDEELRGRAVDVIGARHGERAALVLAAIVRLVLDRRVGLLLVHVFREAAALDDESRNHAMENRAVEESIIDIAQEIGDRQRRVFLEQLYGEIAQRGFKADHDGTSRW